MLKLATAEQNKFKIHKLARPRRKRESNADTCQVRADRCAASPGRDAVRAHSLIHRAGDGSPGPCGERWLQEAEVCQSAHNFTRVLLGRGDEARRLSGRTPADLLRRRHGQDDGGSEATLPVSAPR
ncbi:unnamed protein product [Pleuronectes platessa]|uniref:Uncharacterized protein n=1 Tax=Pleuronectes platessa TaxID=8262 RepID=A0A9N7VLH6_PLEPL|nr:unnamed protein product [Pleuronectes platessa]